MVRAVQLLLGLVFIITGVGFLQAQSWAWTPGLGLNILNLIRTFALAAQNGILYALPGIIIALMIIYYMFSPRVLAFFKLSKQVTGPKPDHSSQP